MMGAKIRSFITSPNFMTKCFTSYMIYRLKIGELRIYYMYIC